MLSSDIGTQKLLPLVPLPCTLPFIFPWLIVECSTVAHHALLLLEPQNQGSHNHSIDLYQIRHIYSTITNHLYHYFAPKTIYWTTVILRVFWNFNVILTVPKLDQWDFCWVFNLWESKEAYILNNIPKDRNITRFHSEDNPTINCIYTHKNKIFIHS